MILNIDNNEFGSELGKFEVPVGFGGGLSNRLKTWVQRKTQDRNGMIFRKWFETMKVCEIAWEEGARKEEA